MAHGFGCTFAMGILPYAAAFQAAGLRVLLFDHKGFGRSEGLPRRQIDVSPVDMHRVFRKCDLCCGARCTSVPRSLPWWLHLQWFEQAAGYCAAVDTVRRRLDVDADRVAVWGESFAANLVLAVGAVHEGVKAVVSVR
jgi:pimeloyl-ACP methyl ester carboxylesterase